MPASFNMSLIFCLTACFTSTPQTLLPTDSTVIDLDPLEPPTQLCEVASYCLTYHAYNTSVPVKRWKNSLANLLGRCTACVEGYEKAKLVIEERSVTAIVLATRTTRR